MSLLIVLKTIKRTSIVLLKEIKEQQFDGMISFFPIPITVELAWKRWDSLSSCARNKMELQILYNHRLTQRRSRSEKSEAEYNQDLAQAFLKKHSIPIVEPKTTLPFTS